MEQPSGFVIEGQEEKVYKLKKAHYGLKQAPRAWNSRIDDYFVQNGSTKCPYEYALYLKTNSHGDILLVCLYVDEFEMTDLDLMAHFLGIEVKQDEEEIFVS